MNIVLALQTSRKGLGDLHLPLIPTACPPAHILRTASEVKCTFD